MEYASSMDKVQIGLKYGIIASELIEEAHNVRINGNYPGKSGNL